jgi:hypothetical protein
LTGHGALARAARRAGRWPAWPAWPAALLSAALAAATPQVAGAEAASFALIGDVPYGVGEEAKFGRVVEAINASHAAGGVSLVVHTGDVKRSGERCDEALLRRRFRLFQRFEPPFVITPGDNDWTDCHRGSGGRYLPTERLVRLRQVFYPRPGSSSGRRPMALATQAQWPGQEVHRAFVENAMWPFAGVMMATVHVVGSDNDLEPWDGIDRRDSALRPRADRLAEFTTREAAAVAWIGAVFDEAERRGSAGVVLAMQANPRLHVAARSSARVGFNRVLATLAERTRRFGRPVLLAHGDTHTFRFEQPLLRATARSGLPALPNLWRVENFGSPLVHWVQVHVDASTPQVFRAEPHLVRANLWPF